MKTGLILTILFLASISYGQNTYFIADGQSEEPIPFVKVTPDVGSPVLADLSGKFTVSASATNVTLHFNGYDDTTFLIAETPDSSIIFMHLSMQQLDPVKVTPGVNPAHRIIRNAIANRKSNHPVKNDAFRYKSYSKFLIDIDPEFVASITEDTQDSTLIELREFADSMHLFLMESVSERYFQPPLRDQEKIVAYKISGLSDPRFSTFAKSMQSFSFYDNQFEVMGRQYVNPLAFGGLNRYLFSLQDTTLNETDTTYTIYFRPKKGKNFDGIEGYLYINTNQFAIEKVIAEPYQDTSGLSVRVVQEYEFTDNRRWFPKRLNTEINLSNLIEAADTENDPDEPMPKIIGSGYTNIEEVTFDPEKVKWAESSVALFTDEEANELSEQEWNDHRERPITDKERNTYQTIDSLSKEANVERIIQILDVLADGKVPLGYVNLDLRRLYRYNLYEKHRLGVGLETSQKLMKPLTIGGYFAYGTGDNEWKYGGFMHLHLWRKKQMRLELSFQQDVMERGGQEFLASQNAWLSPERYRNLFIRSMDRQRLAEAAFRTDIRANLSVRLAQKYQQLSFTDDYHFTDVEGVVWNTIDVAESSIDLEWNPFAKYQIFGTRKLAKESKFPKIRLKVAHGWRGMAESLLDYWRINTSLTHKVKIARILTLDWKVNASRTIGDVPLFFTQVGDGTRVNWNISTPGSFETMPSGYFYSTQQLSTFVRLKFKAFRTNAAWNEPQISLHHAWGIGTFDNRSLHNVYINSFDKGFGEAGIILDGLWVRQFSGFGLGAFYNYSPEYTSDVWYENIVPKISFSFIVN
ncbi:MAG: DUF5686 family protein [bacterium]|nr:DUF5686 family protein [bacterium]